MTGEARVGKAEAVGDGTVVVSSGTIAVAGSVKAGEAVTPGSVGLKGVREGKGRACSSVGAGASSAVGTGVGTSDAQPRLKISVKNRKGMILNRSVITRPPKITARNGLNYGYSLQSQVDLRQIFSQCLISQAVKIVSKKD
jgi:hypothetical protein